MADKLTVAQAVDLLSQYKKQRTPTWVYLHLREADDIAALLQSLEADAAAMSAEIVKANNDMVEMAMLLAETKDIKNSRRRAFALASEANYSLSPSPGASLLERLEAAERVAEAAGEASNKTTYHVFEGKPVYLVDAQTMDNVRRTLAEWRWGV